LSWLADGASTQRFDVQIVDDVVTLVIESRSGALGGVRARNPDYNEALARLGQRGASLVDAVVDSTAARRAHPDPAARRLALDYPVDLAAADPAALRLELRRAAAAAARRPGASSTGSARNASASFSTCRLVPRRSCVPRCRATRPRYRPRQLRRDRRQALLRAGLSVEAMAAPPMLPSAGLSSCRRCRWR
jgi:hypothetical protein